MCLLFLGFLTQGFPGTGDLANASLRFPMCWALYGWLSPGTNLFARLMESRGILETGGDPRRPTRSRRLPGLWLWSVCGMDFVTVSFQMHDHWSLANPNSLQVMRWNTCTTLLLAFAPNMLSQSSTTVTATPCQRRRKVRPQVTYIRKPFKMGLQLNCLTSSWIARNV